MRGARKYSSTIAGCALAILLCLPGCPNREVERPTEPAIKPSAEPVEPEEALDPKSALELDCYEGDQAACDQLGH